MFPVLVDSADRLDFPAAIRGSSLSFVGFPDFLPLTLRNSTLPVDLDGLAALIEACDHIVTIDGVIAHLAGALGKNCTILLPYSANWRWGYESEDSYWHSSLRLLRQNRISDWSYPIEKLKIELDIINNQKN